MNILVLGPAGSGKGTQAEKLAEKFNLIHIDLGKILRQAAKAKTELGKRIHKIINIKKELVPKEIAKEVLHLELSSIPIKQGIVFDGVPRSLDQLEYFKKALGDLGRKIDQVFQIELSEEDGIARIVKRVFCVKCKAGFILGKEVENLDSQCPICESVLAKREDDTEAGVRKRFRVFQEETLPVLAEFEKAGILRKINGDQNPEAVFQEILENINNK